MRMRLVPPGTDPLTVPVEYKERKIPWFWIGCAAFVFLVGYGLTNRAKSAKAQALEATATSMAEMTATPTPTPTEAHPGMNMPQQTPTGYLSALFGNVITSTPRSSGGGFTLPTLPPVRVEVTRIVGVQVTRIVERTVVVVQTQIITGTPGPTSTPEPTQTPWIIVVTATPTETPTPTLTATPTETAIVPGDTETPTPTPTGTATLAAYP